MRYKRLAGWLMGILILALAISCSKDKSPTESEEPQQVPTFRVDTVTVPEKMKQSQDPKAQLAVAYVEMANVISNFGTYFSPPSSGKIVPKIALPQDGPPWTYTWTEDNLTITLTISETADRYLWDIVFDGTDGMFTYNNWKFIHAEAMKDGNSGLMIVYWPVTTNIFMQWEWNIDTQGVYTFVMTFFGDVGGKIEITVNPDDSGTLKFYEEVNGTYALTLKVVWQSDGSGQWWTYEDGTETDSGGWS